MHGPGQTSSIFRLWTCHRSRKSDKLRKILMLNPLPSRQPACYWELAARFMGNKEKHHSVCPWRLLFKRLDHFRGFSPTLFLPFVLSHSFSLHEAVGVHLHWWGFHYLQWLNQRGSICSPSFRWGGWGTEWVGHSCYAVRKKEKETERKNILVL